MDFKVLAIKEEEKLSKEELLRYYNELRKWVVTRKYTNLTLGALILAPRLKTITNRIASKLVPILAGGNVEQIQDGIENIPGGAVLFAHTHQGILDNFAWIPVTPKHCLILHSVKVRRILKIAQLNTGLILVSKEKKNIENRKNATLDMIRLLVEGHSIVYFPEGTWNLSPNKLHLPMSWGFLAIAKKTGKPVIPVVDEYTYDTSRPKERIVKIHISFGTPIYVNPEDSLYDKLNEYSETISTMRWKLIEEKGLCHRDDISNMDYVNFIEGNKKNLLLGGIDLNTERRLIWSADNEFYQFHHINDVPYNMEGTLF